jgi:hypothetical protein
MVSSTVVYKDITSPFDKPWDLSQKADQERWLIASKAASNHVRFDVSIATAKTFLKLLKDKSEYYCWCPLMTVPIDGDGSFDGTKAKLPNGKDAMKIEFGTKVHLLPQWTKVSTTKCQQFAQWYNGDDSMLLSSPFEPDPTKRKVVALNCNTDNNKGLVRRHKVQLRIIDQLILHVLKNHLTTSTYKSCLAHKNEFSFLDEKTGNKIHSGLVLMRKMLNVCKPKTIVEVRHLEKELDMIHLWPTHENSVHLLTTRMMTLLQEIHVKTGKHLYTNQHFLTNLFRALESYPTEKFLSFVDQLKSQWIMEDITLPSDIIQKLDKMHHNMVADGSWLNTNEKDTKIVALTSAIQEVKKKYGELTKKVSFDGGPKGGSPNKKGGASSAAGNQQMKTRCPEWQVTKKGNTIDHKGCKYVWCPKHTFKDGSINGLYTPSPHDHNEWAKAKADKTAAFNKQKEEAKKSRGKLASAKKAKPNNKALKLALGKKMTTALVTQPHMSQTEAENLFNSVYKETMDATQGN